MLNSFLETGRQAEKERKTAKKNTRCEAGGVYVSLADPLSKLQGREGSLALKRHSQLPDCLTD